MPRTARIAPGGVIFHVLNRGNARMTLFKDDADYAAFEKALAHAQAQAPMRVLTYCLMPNHWHLVLWPEDDGDLGRFMQRLTVTHVRRWHLNHGSVGGGHVYQGTYKSFPVQADEHFLAVCRYVERNALRARLAPARRAENWRWSGLWRRVRGLTAGDEDRPELTLWPVEAPRDWVRRVNQAQPRAELQALRLSVARGRPYGQPTWQERTARRLGLEPTFRSQGRPRKKDR